MEDVCVLQGVEDVFECFGCIFRVWRICLSVLVVFSGCGGCVCFDCIFRVWRMCVLTIFRVWRLCVFWLYFQSVEDVCVLQGVEDVFECFGCIFRVWRMCFSVLTVFSGCGGCV